MVSFRMLLSHHRREAKGVRERNRETVVSVVVVVVVFSPKCCQNVCWKREKIKRAVHRKCVSRLENI